MYLRFGLHGLQFSHVIAWYVSLKLAGVGLGEPPLSLGVINDVEVLPLLEAEVLVGPRVVVVQRHEDLVLVHCTQRSHTRQPDTRTTIWRSENY